MKALINNLITSDDLTKFIYQETIGESNDQVSSGSEVTQEDNDIADMGAELNDVSLDDIDPKDMTPEQKKEFVEKIGSDLNFAADWFEDRPLAYVDANGEIHPGDGTTVDGGSVDFTEFRKDCFLVAGKYNRDQYKSIVANLLPSVDKGGYNVRELSSGNALTGGHITELMTYVNSGDEANWTPKVEEVIASVMPGKVEAFRDAGNNFGTKNISVRMELGNRINQAAGSQTRNLAYKETSTEEYNRLKNQ